MHLSLLSFILIFSVFISLINTETEQDEIYINCATPCIPTSDCFYSFCDTSIGVCIETVKDNLPEDCCFTASDCKTGDCVFTDCNLDLNQCEYIPICPNPGIIIPKKACINDNQCQGENPCSLSKCIDNVCISSPLTNPNNDLCCRQASDCASYPCSLSFCDIETFTCFYQPVIGCQFSLGGYSYPAAPPPPGNVQNGHNSTNIVSSRALLYEIPSNYDAGDIFFLIIGCIVLALVVVISASVASYTVYQYFFGDKPLPHDIEEAAAAGHTSHGGPDAAGGGGH